MKCLHNGYGCEDVERRGFVSLMDLYENNFMRIRKLIPDLSTLPESSAAKVYSISRVTGCLDLHLHILEHTKYTTTFVLTYYFPDTHSSIEAYIAEPQLKCRACHDAGLVEVLTGHLLHGKQCYERMPTNAIEVKWRFNRLLYKWLGFSLYLGHSFTHFEAQPVRLENLASLQIVNG